MDIGEKIKAARKSAGLTQKELGEKLGVSAAMIAQYETGKRTPKISTIEKIMNAIADYSGHDRPKSYEVFWGSSAGLHESLKNTWPFNETEKDSSLRDYLVDKVIESESKEQQPSTMAAHFSGDEYTEEELNEIRQFAEFVKARRKTAGTPAPSDQDE